MNIADLFINLQLKGTEKVAGEFANVKKGLGETASMAFETKAALIGVAYALERLFAASGQRGTDLTNFNSVTGVSVQTLQQYEYAARQAGVANEDVAATFKTLQSAMTKTLMGGGAPKGLAHLADVLGIDISEEDISEFAKKPEKLIQVLQKYAQTEKNIGLKNETLKSFGMSDSMIAAMNRNAFNPEALKAAPTYNDKEISQLDKANIAWANLGNKIEMSIGHFNAQHGNELVNGISKITDQVLKLAEAFSVFADKIHLFEWFGKAIEGWTKLLGLFSGAVVDAGNAIDQKGVVGAVSAAGSEVKDSAISAGKILKDLIFGGDKSEMQKADDDLAKKLRDRANAGKPMPAGYNAEGYRANSLPASATSTPPAAAKSVSAVSAEIPRSPVAAPAITPTPAAQSNVIPIDRIARPAALPPINKPGSVNPVTVNQTNNFSHDGSDIQKTGPDLKKATQDGARQLGSLGRVN